MPGIIRHRDGRPVDHFAMIANEWLRDTRLSLRATGLLAHLASHADGYQVSLAALAARWPEGIDAIRTAVVELETTGYLSRMEPKRRPDGTWEQQVWLLHAPSVGNPGEK